MIRITFPDHDLIETTPPGDPPPPRFDADPDISAEIAVERGVATAWEREWVAWLQEPPLRIDRGDTIEVEIPDAGASAYVVDEQAPLLANQDGTFTRLDNLMPDPTESENRP